MNKDDQKKNRERTASIDNAGLASIAGDVIDRYGSGVKEHIVAYSGKDYENIKYKLPDGRIVSRKPATGPYEEIPTINDRSLKSVSQYKRGPQSDPNYKTETKNQAGFSAEIKETARRRAEEAIKGQKPHTARTDDIIKYDSEGNPVLDSNGKIVKHHVNDPLFDITSEVDANGNPVPNSSYQMKFEGSSPKQAVGKLLAKDHEKYIENDVKILVPSDYYDEMQEDLDGRISSLEKQIDSIKQQGKTDVANEKQKQLEKCRKLKKNLRKSKVTNDEAIKARNNPTISTAEDIVKVAHRAGLEQAGTGAAFGGGMSLIRNLVSVIKEEKTPEEAAKDVVLDTASGAMVNYTTAFGGAVIKGTMQNSTSGMVRTLSKTNLPAYVATSTIEVGKTLSSFFAGKIDGVQCLEQLGEKGYGMTVSSLFAVIGQFAIPIPVVGALAGSMIGYALSSVSYNILLGSLKGAKLAREERIRVQRECDEATRMLQQYRKELEEKIAQYLRNERAFFNECFSQIETAFNTGDTNGLIGATNQITEHCGKEPLYRNRDECEKKILGNGPISF